MSDPATADAKHLARVDVLRGAAILLVLVYHSYGAAFGRDRFPWRDMLTGTGADPDPAFLLLYPLHFGWTGVSLFFVISGYVIHRSYLRDRRFTWAGYAARRFWRIYPTYFVVLFGMCAAGHIVRTSNFALHAGLVHNVAAHTFFGINPSFWSLAVEVQLYLLYPLAVLEPVMDLDAHRIARFRGLRPGCPGQGRSRDTSAVANPL